MSWFSQSNEQEITIITSDVASTDYEIVPDLVEDGLYHAVPTGEPPMSAEALAALDAAMQHYINEPPIF